MRFVSFGIRVRSIALIRCSDNGYRLGAYRFAATFRPDVLIRLRLDGNAVPVDSQSLREAVANPLDVRTQPRFLCNDVRVNIADAIPGVAHKANGSFQEIDAVGVFERRVRVGKMLSDVSQRGCPERGSAFQAEISGREIEVEGRGEESQEEEPFNHESEREKPEDDVGDLHG